MNKIIYVKYNIIQKKINDDVQQVQKFYAKCMTAQFLVLFKTKTNFCFEMNNNNKNNRSVIKGTLLSI